MDLSYYTPTRQRAVNADNQVELERWLLSKLGSDNDVKRCLTIIQDTPSNSSAVIKINTLFSSINTAQLLRVLQTYR